MCDCFGGSTPPTTPPTVTGPDADSTPVGSVIAPCPEGNFVLVVGSPGNYVVEDPNHDQFWGNYFIASQHPFGAFNLSAKTSLLVGECAHWLVYEDAYRRRWEDDKASTRVSQQTDAAKYPQGYHKRIQEYVGDLGSNHKYVAINSHNDIWETIHALPDNSLTRLWYFGHAGAEGWYLRWSRDMTRTGVVAGDTTAAEFVSLEKINEYSSWLKPKARPGDGQISKFYGCTTAKWAETWNFVTGLKSQGASGKISFQNIRQDNGLALLETDSSPGWTSYP